MYSQNPGAASKSKENVSSRPINRQRITKGRHHVKFAKSTETNPLAEPVYHSTAALGHQLKKFQQLECDAEGTVLRVLEESETARINLAEKASEAVNISKRETKYSDLISVDVPVEATIAQEIENRMSRLKTSSKQTWHKPSKASEVPPPNIMSVYTPNLMVEEPNMAVPAQTSQDIKPEPCSPEAAFDLYRHMCCWDSH